MCWRVLSTEASVRYFQALSYYMNPDLYDSDLFPPYSILHIPYSTFHTTCSVLHIPRSVLHIPYSRLCAECSVDLLTLLLALSSRYVRGNVLQNLSQYMYIHVHVHVVVNVLTIFSLSLALSSHLTAAI